MKKGFTLLELTVACGILTLAFLGLLAALQSPFSLNEMAKETTVASQDASRVMEAIRQTDFSAIATTNWTTWAQTNGLTHLVNETVAVTTGGGNPLTIKVQVQWTSQAGKGPNRQFLLTTRRSS